MVPFFPPAESVGLFLPYSPWGTGRTTRGKTHKKVVISLWQVPPKIFSSQSCLSRPNLQQSINYSLDCFPSRYWFLQKFLLRSFSSSKLWFSVSVCLSNFGTADLICDLTSFVGLRIVIGFSVCLGIYLLPHHDNFYSRLQSGMWKTNVERANNEDQ